MLTEKELPAQLSLLLARWAITAKPNFLARTLPPHITEDLLKDFDEAVINTVEQRNSLRFVGFHRTLLQLPMRHGGV